MKQRSTTTLICLLLAFATFGQNAIPLDTAHWDINAQAYLLENYNGSPALYIQNGRATLKNTSFENGTIEFDVYLTKRQSFPGVNFRITDGGNAESFYLRPHLPGKPDGNQALPIYKGISAWQIYFGPQYSFSYDYNYTRWTHVKLVVKDQTAQVYLDHSSTPHLTWQLHHQKTAGAISIGSSAAPMHFANISVRKTASLGPSTTPEATPVEGAIQEWSVSNKIEEKELLQVNKIESVLAGLQWNSTLKVEENSIANLSKLAQRYGSKGNTVVAKITINTVKAQTKQFEFGYSDRAIVILNGKPIYWGNNRWRSRDYRYLGTIGLFDGVYLPLKKGENHLYIAVTEDFGGWGVIGRFTNMDGIKLE